MPFIISTNMGIILSLVLIGVGFAIATWMRYPRHVLKTIVYALLKKNPRPNMWISSDGYMFFDIMPKKDIIWQKTEQGEKPYLKRGPTLNLFGQGQGHIFYESSSIPLDLTPHTLEEDQLNLVSEHKETLGIKGAHRAISTDELKQFGKAWRNLGYELGKRKARRSNQMMIVIVALMSTITLGIVGYILLNQQDMLAYIQKMAQMMTQGGQAGGGGAIAPGGQYGIK